MRVALALCLGLAAGAAAAEPAPYLKAGALDAAAILLPPPKPGSAAHAADAAAYAATRRLAGSPRWSLATADVASGIAALLDDFSCAAGRRLDPARLPALRDRVKERHLALLLRREGVVVVPEDLVDVDD